MGTLLSVPIVVVGVYWLSVRLVIKPARNTHRIVVVGHDAHNIQAKALSDSLKKRDTEYQKSGESKRKKIVLQRAGASYVSRSKPYKNENTFVLNVSGLNNVVDVDVQKKIILVEPSVTFRQIVDFCLTLSPPLMPLVVPELEGITVGGGFQGLAGESTCFRNGLFDESVLWFDLLLPSGEILRCGEVDGQMQNEDLFYASRGSFGSLGVLLLMALKLEETKNYVQLRYTPYSDLKLVLKRFDELMSSRGPNDPDFIDGISFSDNLTVLIEGKKVSAPTTTAPLYSPKWYSPWYYKHVSGLFSEEKPGDVQSWKEQTMKIDEYLFRYDRGTFWIASYKIGDGLLNRLLFGYLMVSENLFTFRANHRTDAQTESKGFLQDLAVPSKNFIELTDAVYRSLRIFPLWFCPIKNVNPERRKIFGVGDRFTNYINVGVYGDPRIQPYVTVDRNREMESLLTKLGGQKVLYGCSYYTPDEFAQLYDMKTYETLRKKYVPHDDIPTIYDKVIRHDVVQHLKK